MGKRTFNFEILVQTKEGRKSILRLIADKNGRKLSLPKHKWDKYYLELLSKYANFVETGVIQDSLVLRLRQSLLT